MKKILKIITEYYIDTAEKFSFKIEVNKNAVEPTYKTADSMIKYYHSFENFFKNFRDYFSDKEEYFSGNNLKQFYENIMIQLIQLNNEFENLELAFNNEDVDPNKKVI